MTNSRLRFLPRRTLLIRIGAVNEKDFRFFERTLAGSDDQRRDVIFRSGAIDEVDLIIDHAAVGHHFGEISKGSSVKTLQKSLNERPIVERRGENFRTHKKFFCTASVDDVQQQLTPLLIVVPILHDEENLEDENYR